MSSSLTIPEPPAADVREVSGRERRKAFVGATAGHVIEWYDYGVYGFLAVYVGANFFSDKTNPAIEVLSAFAVFALSFFVRPLGGLFFGPLADRIGRRKTLMIVLSLMCGATMCIGFLPTFAQIGVVAPGLLVLLRVVQGFSAGGEISTITAFVSEYSQKGGRGLATSYLMITATAGLLLGGIVGNGMTWILGADAMNAWGWRIPFLIAGPLGAVAIWIRMRLEDSPEFQALHSEDRLAKAPLREALRFPRQLLLVAALITLLGSSFYLLMTFMSTYMRTALKLDPGTIFWLVLVAGVTAAIMMPIGGHLSDRMGDRRPLMAVGAIAFALAVVWFFVAAPQADGVFGITLPLVVLAATTGLYCGAPYASMSELLPAHIRSTGIALGYNIPIAVFGGSAPFVAQWLIATTGSVSSPAWFFVATAVIGLIGALAMKPHDLLGHEDLAVTGSIDAAAIRAQARQLHGTGI